MMDKKSVKIGIIVAILLLAVGFAAVTTTLNITGTTVISPNDSNFAENVSFNSTSLTHNGETVENAASLATTTNNNDTINVTIPEMKDLGDTYLINYTIRNDSQYNARLGKLACSITNNKVTASEYVSITPTNELENTVLNRNSTSSTGTVRVEMIRSYNGVVGSEEVGSLTFNISCNMVATGESAS